MQTVPSFRGSCSLCRVCRYARFDDLLAGHGVESLSRFDNGVSNLARRAVGATATRVVDCTPFSYQVKA